MHWNWQVQAATLTAETLLRASSPGSPCLTVVGIKSRGMMSATWTKLWDGVSSYVCGRYGAHVHVLRTPSSITPALVVLLWSSMWIGATQCV